MNGREAKDALNEQFARTAKAIAHPKRLELLDVLAQGERSVDALAAATAANVTTTSANLQVLRRSGLVTTRREGVRIIYRLAGLEVDELVAALRSLAQRQVAEVERISRTFLEDRDQLEPVSREQLLEQLAQGTVVLIDVRPAEEYAAGHIPGAHSVPLDELSTRLAELPHDATVVAYCRGPYCVLAPEAVALLRQHGYNARRLTDGMPEWRLAGLPIESSLAA